MGEIKVEWISALAVAGFFVWMVFTLLQQNVRRRTLRRTSTPMGRTVYIWSDIFGTEHRSHRHPELDQGQDGGFVHDGVADCGGGD